MTRYKIECNIHTPTSCLLFTRACKLLCLLSLSYEADKPPCTTIYRCLFMKMKLSFRQQSRSRCLLKQHRMFESLHREGQSGGAQQNDWPVPGECQQTGQSLTVERALFRPTQDEGGIQLLRTIYLLVDNWKVKNCFYRALWSCSELWWMDKG